MNLFIVRTVINQVVFAETEEAACRLCDDRSHVPATSAIQLSDACELPWGWDKNCIPVGSIRTIRQIVEGRAA